MTVLGIDISKWDGSWDPQTSKTAGVDFAYIKASQATATDPLFQVNWVAARNTGLLRGAYHYLDYTRPATDQANHFADLLDKDRGELPPAVDFEQKRPDNNVVLARAYLREFLEGLGARGYKPLVYTGPAFWSEYGEKNAYWASYPLWIAHYTSAAGPSVPDPWTRWLFWQFSVKGQGDTYGTESKSVDLNRFDGSLDDLLALAGRPNGVAALQTALAALAARTESLERRLVALETAGGGTLPPAPPSPPPPGPNPVETWALCHASGLNIRSGPGTGHPIVGGITYGQRVRVIAKQDGWAQIENPAGWCSERYIEYESNGNGGSSPTTATFAICLASGLNVRSGPAATFPVVGGLVYGQRAKVMQRENGWAQLENPAGWGSESYLRIESSNA